MPIKRLGPSSRSYLGKAVQSGGGQTFGVPDRWMQTAYGSGWPVAPVSAPRDVELPRTIDYPLSVNSTLTPRTGYGLMPYSALLEAYENVTECKMPVSLIHRELRSFKPHLVDSDGNEIDDHPFQWMCEAPDRETPFTVWLTRFLKSAQVYDAPAIYLGRSRRGGDIDSVHYIDGSTLFLIVDQYGRVPKAQRVDDYVRETVTREQAGLSSTPSTPVSGTPAPDNNIRDFVARYESRRKIGLPVPEQLPAFTQIIKGTPFAWWSADDIWYQPQSPRMNAPYGESFIEQAWPWIMIVVNITAFELGHYRTGNMPEGFITVSKDWFSNPDSIFAAELMYNMRMTGDPVTERNRLRIFPEGTTYTATKKPDFPAILYKQAWNNILHTIGIPPSEFGDIPGSGLGGKGFKEGAESDLSRNTLDPMREFVAAPFNYILEQSGVDDAHWELAYDVTETDPEKKAQAVYDGMARGTLTLNDALGELNKQPVGDPEDKNNLANKHLIVAGSVIYVVEDMDVQNGIAVPTFGGVPGGDTGGVPVGPETAVAQTGAKHTPDDTKTLMDAIQNIIDRGTLNNKFISIPASVTVKAAPSPAPVQKADDVPLLNDMFQSVFGMGPVDDLSPLDKHCGVCPDDDDYFGAPVRHEAAFSFPNGNHANGVEIVAVEPPGLPSKAFLWKPEGEEILALQDWIGGPQYVREEAAYLLDRSLGFMLAPVAFVADVNGEAGAAVYYTAGATTPKPPTEYALDWIERAAVLDYIGSQLDRGYRHNYLTHPDDPMRLILIDNGLAFPVDEQQYTQSIFAQLMINKPLSDPTLAAIALCIGDASTWADIGALIGKPAVAKARTCAMRLLTDRMITESNLTPPTVGADALVSNGSAGL